MAWGEPAIRAYMHENKDGDFIEYQQAKEVIEKLVAELVPKWISVSEQLPEKNTQVIAAFKSMYNSCLYHVTDCHYDGRWKMHGNDNVGDTYCSDPTHWMPLLQAPKVQSETFDVHQDEEGCLAVAEDIIMSKIDIDKISAGTLSQNTVGFSYPVGAWIIGGGTGSHIQIYEKPTEEQIKNTEQTFGWKWKSYEND